MVSTIVVVAVVLVLVVMVAWAVCVIVATRSRKACSAVLNAGGYIYRPNGNSAGGGAAATPRPSFPNSPASQNNTPEYHFCPEDDVYVEDNGWRGGRGGGWGGSIRVRK
jgi:hypothetical protein